MRGRAWFLILLVFASAATADTPATLLRWDGVGAPASNRGPGVTMFRLEAAASWAASAPRDPNRYAIRLTLPGGSTITQPLAAEEAPPSRVLTVLVPAESIRDLRPEAVRVSAVVVEAATGVAVSNPLEATIDDFANPGLGEPDEERGPFGWGQPLAVPSPGAAPLPRPSPSGLRFLRVEPGGERGFFLATTEASVEQVRSALPDYDPRAGRSDDFRLEDPSQPAVGLSPKRAQAFLENLGKADGTGVAYRLPTEEEWSVAATAGRPSPFWWGDRPIHPEGANFLGSEPALAIDTTAPTSPSRGEAGYKANPWGLFHTFGNTAEWAVRTDGGFVRMGGHFRTEPAAPLPVESLEGADGTGPDPYVGVRPALDLTAESGASIARKALGPETFWGSVRVGFDPGRATVTLVGSVSATSHRKLADQRLSGLWFVAAVDDRLSGPGVPAGRLANLEGRVLAKKRRTPLGRTIDELTIPVRWASRLAVQGSRWYVNVYSAEGRHFSHPLIGGRPDPRVPLVVAVDRGAVGLRDEGLRVALSLGAPAPSAEDASVVSNVLALK